GEIKIGERGLTGGDIAILVHSNRDAAGIKELLRKRGVGTVTYSRDKVFESKEAWRIWQLMSAALDPSDQRAVQSALVTGFFEADISTLYHKLNDDASWQRVTSLFQRLNERWYEAGFYPMF